MSILPPIMLIPPPEPRRVCAACKIPVERTTVTRDGVLVATWMCPNCGREDADPPFDGPVKRY